MLCLSDGGSSSTDSFQQQKYHLLIRADFQMGLQRESQQQVDHLKQSILACDPCKVSGGPV